MIKTYDTNLDINMTIYDQIWPNTTKYDQIWSNMTELWMPFGIKRLVEPTKPKWNFQLPSQHWILEKFGGFMQMIISSKR